MTAGRLPGIYIGQIHLICKTKQKCQEFSVCGLIEERCFPSYLIWKEEKYIVGQFILFYNLLLSKEKKCLRGPN